MPITPQRNVRIPDDEWKRFAAACEANATTPGTVIRQAVRAYLQEMAALNQRGLVLEDHRRYIATPTS
jgi:predicted DNA-binding protein